MIHVAASPTDFTHNRKAMKIACAAFRKGNVYMQMRDIFRSKAGPTAC